MQRGGGGGGGAGTGTGTGPAPALPFLGDLRILVAGLTTEQRRDIQMTFALFDTDRDGCVYCAPGRDVR
jgi:hypothetical protein